MNRPTRLFGLPGAERMHDSPETAWELEIDGRAEAKEGLVIEEWTVRPARSHFPCADDVVEVILRWVAEDGELPEEADIDFDGPDVRAAAESLLDLMASKLGWSMADRKVAEWDVVLAPGEDYPTFTRREVKP